jgi:hypothetical protein
VDIRAQVSADAVVIVDARQPNLELAAAASELCGESVDIHVIGDCAQPMKESVL